MGRPGLFMIAFGISGMLLAFLLSLAGSGRIVERELSAEITGEDRRRLYEVLGITGGLVDSKIVLIIENRGSASALVSLGENRLEIGAGQTVKAEIVSVEERISVSWLGEGGTIRLIASVAVREGIRPELSIIAMIVFFISMIIATVGMIEAIIMRRL